MNTMYVVSSSIPATAEPATSSFGQASTPADSTIRVIDLFAGAGGFTAGFRAASTRFQTIRAVEWDTAAAASYEATFGEGIVFAGSIQDWLATEQVPEVDLIVGGPPCQGFSTLGKQDEEDERNELWQEYMRTILKAKPKYFVVENVAAFAKSPQFDRFKAETESGGRLQHYTFQHRVLNAADYGAPQARKRTVVIGHLRTLPFPGWPQPSHLGRHRSVKDAFDDAGVSIATNGIDLPTDRLTPFNGRSLAGPFTRSELHLTRRYTKLSMDRFEVIGEGENRFDLARKAPELLPKCWIGHTTGSADVMGRLHWGKPSVTIRTEFFKPEKGRYLHPTENRAITHFEAAVLQGFPPEHMFVGSKTAIAKQIGNAVPVPLGKAIAEKLLESF